MKILKEGAVDFITISYYMTYIMRYKGEPVPKPSGSLVTAIKNPYLEASEWGWPIDPIGFRITLNHIYDRYHLPIFISENGLGAIDELDENGYVEDDYRIDFVKGHLRELHRAIEDGANCKGYLIWTFIDCWSWLNSYKNRYGLVELDLETQERRLKKSGHWFKELSDHNGF